VNDGTLGITLDGKEGWKSGRKGRMNQGNEGKKGRNGSITPPFLLPLRAGFLLSEWQNEISNCETKKAIRQFIG